MSPMKFLKLPINYSIVTNIDQEHLDYYKSYNNLENAFIEFINKTPPIGKSIICIDNTNIKKILKKIKNKNTLTYGFSKNANYRISNSRFYTTHSLFDLNYKNLENKKKKIKNINLKLIGEHNILNASAAIAVCLNLGVKIDVIKKALRNFSGVQRRMTKIFTKNKMNFLMTMPPSNRNLIYFRGVKKFMIENYLSFEPQIPRIKSLKQAFSKSFINLIWF